MRRFEKYSPTFVYQDDEEQWMVAFRSRESRNEALRRLNHQPALGTVLRLLSDDRDQEALSTSAKNSAALREAVMERLTRDLTVSVVQQLRLKTVERTCGLLVDQHLKKEKEVCTACFFTHCL